MAQGLVCWNCGNSLADVPRPISRHVNCSECFSALHCCRLCIYYRPSIQGQCDHERADPPVVKENANFCEYFKPQRGAFESEKKDRQATAKSQLDALFGDSGSPDHAPGDAGGKDADDDLRSRLDDLFDD